jgi:Zn-finger nucleic acid-binding protein
MVEGHGGKAMAKPAVGKVNLREKGLLCPRDEMKMEEKKRGEAFLDICGKCGGQFFDSGEMFGAFGIKADPSYWDRPETGGSVKDGALHCPVCHTHMLVQDVKHEAEHVEIDRCGKCGGIWLDKGEVEHIMKIGQRIKPILEKEKAKAEQELAKMGDVNFSPPGIMAQFLAMFGK